MSDLRLFLPITKIDEEWRVVYGVLTEEVVEKSGEMFDYANGKTAVQAWSDEIREASKGKSLGKFTDIVYDNANMGTASTPRCALPPTARRAPSTASSSRTVVMFHDWIDGDGSRFVILRRYSRRACRESDDRATAS